MSSSPPRPSTPLDGTWGRRMLWSVPVAAGVAWAFSAEAFIVGGDN
jgi:hypothetical protein